MAELTLESPAISDLGRAIIDARVTLFTGSGFSCEARDRRARRIPCGAELRRELWDLCFRGDKPDESSLADLFAHALVHRPDSLLDLLRERFAIDPRTLPAHYLVWFAMPWRRVYTLNVDDLEMAVARRFPSVRPIRSVSATRRAGEVTPPRPETLDYIHLNGIVSEAPDGITFSTTQYAQRIVGSDPWYAELGKDLASQPFLFVGTQLEETPLWQHLEVYGRRRARERHRSLLVTAQLTRVRTTLLEDLDIDWIRSSSRRFAATVLEPLLRDHPWLSGEKRSIAS